MDKLILLGAKHPGAKEDTWHMQSLWSVWRIEVRNISYGESLGSYEEVISSPLAKAETARDIERFDWPDPMAWDVSHLRAECGTVALLPHPGRLLRALLPFLPDAPEWSRRSRI